MTHRAPKLLVATIAAAAALALVPAAAAGSTPPAPARTVGAATVERPTRTPIKHLVTLMQENHSFDNYFGTYPGADGIPADTCMPVEPADAGAHPCVKPFHLGDRAITDLGHSAAVFDAQFNGGRMDGFLSAFRGNSAYSPDQAMGYYDDRDIPYYWNVADNYVLFDRFFTSSKGGSITNHMYWISGSPGIASLDEREAIPSGGFDAPTIFDRLEEAGISWKFYVQNYDPSVTFRTFRAPDKGGKEAQVVWVPLLAYARYLDDPDLFSKIVPLEEYHRDLERGTLPAVSYIVPSGASEHPPGSVAAGTQFVRTLIDALMRSSAWDESAFLWTYDDWGGWFDHVAPPAVDEFGYGFRAPALLVSPYARKGHVDSTELDFTSILRFIEENWGLEPLTERDAQAKTFLSAFELSQGPRTPVFLGTSRQPASPPSPGSGLVYAAYATAATLCGLLTALAARRIRRRANEGRGVHDPAGPADSGPTGPTGEVVP